MAKVCLIDKVEARIAEALADWDAGRTASPDQLDYVIYADEILREVDPAYETPTWDPVPFEAIADEMYQVMSDGRTLMEVRAMAIFVVARLYGLDTGDASEEALDAVAEQIHARLPELPETRTFLIHLNATVPADEALTPDEYGEMLLAAIRDAEPKRKPLDIVVALAEEI